MKQTVSPIAQRIALKLDVGMAFEALILNRLARLPNTRRQEWLRRLLVQGFQCECLALRKLQRRLEPEREVPPSGQKLAAHQSLPPVRHQAPRQERMTVPQADSTAINTQQPGGKVSFAALRKVIG